MLRMRNRSNDLRFGVSEKEDKCVANVESRVGMRLNPALEKRARLQGGDERHGGKTQRSGGASPAPTKARIGQIGLLGVLAVGDGDAEGGAIFFAGVLVEGLGGFGGVVVAPEPGQFGGKFGGAVGGVVGAAAEAEMEIVASGFERVGHAEVGERPVAVAK